MKPTKRNTVELTLWILAALVIFTAIVSASLSRAGDAPNNRLELYWGAPSEDYICRTGYVHARPGHYTAWTIEYLTPDRLTGNAKRDKETWHSDPDQPAEFRWTNADYSKSGFDKGHLAPAADEHSSVKAMRDSFILTNTTPQTPELNRGKRAWEGLEEHVRELVAVEGTEAWVVTLPLFVPDGDSTVTVRTIGENHVWCPTHCAKCLLIRRDGELSMKAWMLPNNATPPDFTECETTVDAIERDAGYDLFSGVGEREDALEAGE